MAKGKTHPGESPLYRPPSNPPRATAIGEIPVRLYAYFPAGATEQLATINPGDPIAATGTLSRADLTEEPNGHGVRLNVDLMECHANR